MLFVHHGKAAPHRDVGGKVKKPLRVRGGSLQVVYEQYLRDVVGVSVPSTPHTQGLIAPLMISVRIESFLI